MKEFNLPYTINLTPEQEAELNVRDAQDKAYLIKDLERIKREWNRPKSKLRLISDYISTHFQDDLDIQKLSNELDIKSTSIKKIIMDLNFWHEFGYPMKRVKGVKGFIHSIWKNHLDTEDYLRKKSRCIAKMEAVHTNLTNKLNSKKIRKPNNKETIKQKTKNN